MTREELKKIIEGITDEQVDKIIGINGADINKAKNNVAALKTEIETLKQSKTELETKIDEMSKNAHTVDEYKNRLEELKKQYAEEAQKAEAERKAQEEAARIETRFNSAAGDKKFMHSAIKAEYLKKFTEALKAEENAGRSDSEIFSEMTKDDARAFENVTPIKLGGINTNSFVNEKNTITRDDIMKIKNTKERHRAIAENPELFGIE